MASPLPRPDRLAALRALMAEEGLDGWLVPHADEFGSEYLPACAERLAWLTGFTGSAGTALILADRAILFVDGRYTLQAAGQVDALSITIEDGVATPPSAWLGRFASEGLRVGFDPWLTSLADQRRLATVLADRSGSLVASANLVDRVWTDRPAAPSSAIRIHDSRFTGETAAERVQRLQEDTRKAGATHLLLSDPLSVAWAFNLRGSDIDHTPLALLRALVPASGRATLFVSADRLTHEAAEMLEPLASLHDPVGFTDTLTALGERARLLLDPSLAPAAAASAAQAGGATLVEGRDPALTARAIKTPAEIAGARAANLRDGVAVTRFLCWLDGQVPDSLDEMAAADRLLAFRRDTADRLGVPLRDLSFPTISGAGPNGAIIHYHATADTRRPLRSGELYLIDSGAQYDDGTTDITRTVALGTPPADAVLDATLVLKGHIAVATARFPALTRGVDLDPLARIALWMHGRDYAHGTGHGIGSYLSVHEGPASISRRGTEPLRAGMILSNEPGYYRAGHWGVRLENLLLVTPAEPIDGGDMPMHGFETLSLAPFDRRIIDARLLDGRERDWLDRYHARVSAALSDHLDEAERGWLARACAPLQNPA